MKADQEPTIPRLLKDDFEKRKRQLANFLNAQFERLPSRNRKLFFILLAIVLGSAIIGVTHSSFRHPVFFLGGQYQRDATTLLPDSTGEDIVTPDEYNVIIKFTQSLDSLKSQNPLGYKDLMDVHPGLLDSIHLLINIYQTTH